MITHEYESHSSMASSSSYQHHHDQYASESSSILRGISIKDIRALSTGTGLEQTQDLAVLLDQRNHVRVVVVELQTLARFVGNDNVLDRAIGGVPRDDERVAA